MDFYLYIWVFLIFGIFKNIGCSKIDEDLNGYVVLENYHSLKLNSYIQNEDNELELQEITLCGEKNAIYDSIQAGNRKLNNLVTLTDISTEQEEIYKKFIDNNYLKHVKELKERRLLLLECNELGKSSYYNTQKEFSALESCCNTIVLDFVLFLNTKRSKMGKTINHKNFHVSGFSCSEDLVWTFYCEYKSVVLVKGIFLPKLYSISWKLEDAKDYSCFFDKNFKIDIIKIDNDSDLAAEYFKHIRITNRIVSSDENKIIKEEDIAVNMYESYKTSFWFFIGVIMGLSINFYHIFNQ